MQIAIAGDDDAHRAAAPHRDAAYLLDPQPVIVAREARLARLELRELMELEDRAAEHETAVRKLRRLLARGNVEPALLIDAVLENGVVGKGEGVAAQVEGAGVQRGGREEKDERQEKAEHEKFGEAVAEASPSCQSSLTLCTALSLPPAPEAKLRSG